MQENTLKTKLGKLLSRIGNKLQDKPNLLLTPNTEPIIQYDMDKFELIQVQYKASTTNLLEIKQVNIEDRYLIKIKDQLADKLAHTILEKHKNDIEIYEDLDYTTYSLKLLVSKPKKRDK